MTQRLVGKIRLSLDFANFRFQVNPTNICGVSQHISPASGWDFPCSEAVGTVEPVDGHDPGREFTNVMKLKAHVKLHVRKNEMKTRHDVSWLDMISAQCPCVIRAARTVWPAPAAAAVVPAQPPSCQVSNNKLQPQYPAKAQVAQELERVSNWWHHGHWQAWGSHSSSITLHSNASLRRAIISTTHWCVRKWVIPCHTPKQSRENDGAPYFRQTRSQIDTNAHYYSNS